MSLLRGADLAFSGCCELEKGIKVKQVVTSHVLAILGDGRRAVWLPGLFLELALWDILRV